MPTVCQDAAWVSPVSPHLVLKFPSYTEKLSPQLIATALSVGGGQKKECFFWLGIIIEGFPVVVT